MKFSGEKRRKKSVFDVQASSEKPHSSKSFFHNLFYGRNVLNLKPKFRVRHPWVWISAIILVAVVAFLGIRNLGTRAEVQDFYPTTCLGNWQNPANAQGSPETLATASTSFTGDNSAVYDGSDTQIFCGGFVPPAFATSGQITNVGLTLVWQVGDTPSSSVSESASPPAPDVDSSSSATSSVTSNTTSSVTAAPTSTASTSTVATPIAPVVVASSTPVSPSTVSSTPPDDEASSTDASPSSTPDVLTPPASADISATSTDSAPTSSGTSFIRSLIPFAFADEVDTNTAVTTTPSLPPASDTTTTVVLGPPLIANLASSSSSGATGTSLSATSSAIALPPPPAPPDENFLDVSYSTDGQTWISIGEVTISNWQQFTVTLPISDWSDLQNLQVRVQGIPTTQDPVPPVYLDGMLVEVHYDEASLLDLTQATSTEETTSSLSPAPPARMTLVNPGAEQSCDIEPFSQVLPLGGTAAFTVNLRPSINGVSYNLQLGHLPAGVSADIGSPSGNIAATSSLTFQAETSTLPGSFNIALIYQENEEDGSSLANFCQLNLDVQ